MSAKRGIWALIGKLLWSVISFFLHIAARLGSRWARKRLDRYEAEHASTPIGRFVRRRRAA